MKQIPLEEYIDKLVAYNEENDVSTVFKSCDTFTSKYELIKDTSFFTKTISDIYKRVFIKYMNDDEWTW